MKKTTQNNSIGNLLIQICKVRRNKSNSLLSEVGIHSGQDALLYYLSLEDGQTVSSLVEKLCIQQGTISSMIERMETFGVIKKEKDLVDKRTSRVFLTDKGKEALKKIGQVWSTMETATVKGLTVTEQDKLRELLIKVLVNLK
jgi:DNA-binding MarR family transcriptional regulator